MEALGNLNVNLSNIYIKPDLPNLELGDTVKVTIYLELPKEVAEGEKKERAERGGRRGAWGRCCRRTTRRW